MCSSSCDSRSVGTYLYHHFGSTTLSTALELFNEYVNHPSMMSKARRQVAISIAICESKSLEHAPPSTKDLTRFCFTSMRMIETRSDQHLNVLWKLSSNRKHRNTIAFRALKLRLDGHLGERDTIKVATLLSKETAIAFENKQHVSLRSVQVLAVHVSSK